MEMQLHSSDCVCSLGEWKDFQPAPQDVVVIVTAAKLLSTDTFPPDTRRIDGRAEESRGGQPG